MLDRGPLDRARRPLAVIAALVLVIDLIGLGLHLADAVENPFANDAPTPARARVGGPEAVVPGPAVAGTQTQRTPQAARPLGCLALDSGCYPTAAPAPGAAATPPGKAPTAGPPQRATPVAQADLGVPALGAQVSLGLGDGSCTSLELTVIALGDCPAATGEGPVVLNLGGSLLGD
jgi:hypothetical protein